jgi:hypothetical protein
MTLQEMIPQGHFFLNPEPCALEPSYPYLPV